MPQKRFELLEDGEIFDGDDSDGDGEFVDEEEISSSRPMNSIGSNKVAVISTGVEDENEVDRIINEFRQELLQQCKNQIPEEKQDVGIDSEMVDSEEDENTLRRAAIISCKKNNVLNDDNCDVEEGEIIENGRDHHNWDKLLHDTRMEIEAKATDKGKICGDNYEQLAMEIVDSDDEKQDNSMNISSKQNSEMVIAKEQSTDHEDEAEKLRAALLEQLNQNQNSMRKENEVDDIGHVSSRRYFSAVERQKLKELEKSIEGEKIEIRNIENRLYRKDSERIYICQKRERLLEQLENYSYQIGLVEGKVFSLRNDLKSAQGRLYNLKKKYAVVKADLADKITERKLKKTGERRSEFGKYTTANVRKRKRVGSNEIPQDNGSMMVYPEQISHDHSLPKTVPSSHSFNAALSSSADKVNECSDMIFNENPVHSSVIENLGNFQESNLTFDSEKTGVTEETFSKYAFMKSTTESFDEMAIGTGGDTSQANENIFSYCPSDERETNQLVQPNSTRNHYCVAGNEKNRLKQKKQIVTSEENGLDCEEISSELENNPLFMFNGYRLCSTFPYEFIHHKSISNKIDPLRPLCPYELFGICKDHECVWQHVEDYIISDEELICGVIAHYPALCPPDKSFYIGRFAAEYAKELLENSSQTVGEIIRNMLNSVPSSNRKIIPCEMIARCNLPKDFCDEENANVVYEVPEAFKKLILSNDVLI
ncbi:unnamed protein product [Dracunculus medinensis]|uniref:Zf-C3H1 domain-containing protein n=1 Tax=Dracunculus medinensis TaxID=318479 RepID=A0A158Q5N0_DRAME|nr:unnamed protein product [Dracunculus medinensis]